MDITAVLAQEHVEWVASFNAWHTLGTYGLPFRESVVAGNEDPSTNGDEMPDKLSRWLSVYNRNKFHYSLV